MTRIKYAILSGVFVTGIYETKTEALHALLPEDYVINLPKDRILLTIKETRRSGYRILYETLKEETVNDILSPPEKSFLSAENALFALFVIAGVTFFFAIPWAFAIACVAFGGTPGECGL